MYRDHAVAVVVPAYREERFVGSVVESLPWFVDRVYAVDDASPDATWDVLRSVTGPAATRRESLPVPLEERVASAVSGDRVVALRHARNYGAGGAIKTGYLAALADDVDLVATLDGDGQMNPGVLEHFLNPLVEGVADYATGTRLVRDRDRDGMPAFRRFGNRSLTHLARAATGYPRLSDPVNGYTAATAGALRTLDVSAVHEGYGYGIDVLGRLHANGCRVVDVPHASRYADETSTIRYHTYVPSVSRLLAATWLRRVRRETVIPGVADRLRRSFRRVDEPARSPDGGRERDPP